MSSAVVVLRWPEQVGEVERLDLAGLPRLLLVEPGAAPPPGTSCLQDWLRLPADGADMRTRLVALAERTARHPVLPVLDEHGQLSHRGHSVFLSPIPELLTRVLLDNLGHPVTAEELIRSVWSGDTSESALRVHIFRLRRQLTPLGLTITTVRGHGYVMRERDTAMTRSAPGPGPQVCGHQLGSPNRPD